MTRFSEVRREVTPERRARIDAIKAAHGREEAVKALTPLMGWDNDPSEQGAAARELIDGLDANPTARAALARYLSTDTGEGLPTWPKPRPGRGVSEEYARGFVAGRDAMTPILNDQYRTLHEAYRRDLATDTGEGLPSVAFASKDGEVLACLDPILHTLCEADYQRVVEAIDGAQRNIAALSTGAPGLDVERLARAICMAECGMRPEGPAWGYEFHDEFRAAHTAHAKIAAAEYARLATEDAP